MAMAPESTYTGGRVTVPLMIVIISICMGSSFQIYSNSVINNLASICQSWMNQSFTEHYGYHLTDRSMTILWPFSSAAVQLGALTGAFFTRYLADRFGRRKALIIISVSTILGSLLCGFAKFANSFEMFIAGRYMIGGGLGCGMALASILITEIAPVRSRGACGSCQQILFGFGNAFSFVMTLSEVLGTETWWPITVGIPPFVTGMTQFLVLIFYAYDSPKFLILTKGDLTQGLKALRFYQGTDGAEERLKAILEEKKIEAMAKNFNFTDLFRKRSTRMPLLIAMLIFFALQVTGVSAVMAYSKTMFVQAGLSHHMAQYASLGIGVCNFLSPLLTTCLVERAGRRVILLFGLILCDVSLLAMTMCIVGTNAYNWPGAAVGSIPCLFTFIIGVALANSIALIAPAELFPQEVRASAMTVIFVLMWFLQSLCVLLYLPFSMAMGKQLSFVPFMVCTTISIILIAIFLPETKGKTVTQVAAIFGKASVVDSGRIEGQKQSG